MFWVSFGVVHLYIPTFSLLLSRCWPTTQNRPTGRQCQDVLSKGRKNESIRWLYNNEEWKRRDAQGKNKLMQVKWSEQTICLETNSAVRKLRAHGGDDAVVLYFFHVFQGLTWWERNRDIKDALVTGVNVCVIVLQGCISTKAGCKGKQKEAETLKCSYRQQSVFITWQVLLLDSVGALPVESVYHVLLVSALYPVTNGKEIKKSFPLWRNSFSCYKTLAKVDGYIFFSVNIWFNKLYKSNLASRALF